MSNRVSFQFTRFQDLNTDLSPLQDPPSYGYRIYDDYDEDYCNTLEPKDLARIDAKEAFRIIKCQDKGYEIAVLGNGFFFNDEWVEVDTYGNIQPMLPGVD